MSFELNLYLRNGTGTALQCSKHVEMPVLSVSSKRDIVAWR